MEETAPGSRASRFVPITTVGDLSRARVLAALLEAEGIEVRLHSESLGPYPVTIGALATAELWVPSDRVEEAGRVLLDAEVDDAFGAVEHEGDDSPMLELRVVAVAMLVVIVLAVVLRLMRVF